jgi:hypothetical protein
MWCIPPQQNAAFVADMEQVLDVYQQSYDPDHPVVCTDESNKQIIGDVKAPLPIQLGQIMKEDCNYERKGTCNLFIAFEPAVGQRDITVTVHRGKCDWAHYIKKIAQRPCGVDELYPDAQCVTLMCDQLNTHSLSSLYATFPAAEAHRIARRIHIVHTPKHGSWLNTVRAARAGGTPARDGMAEIEFSALNRQCLDRRFKDQSELEQEVQAWTQARNQAGTSVKWRFTLPIHSAC